ncbi:MAG: response regulator [Blastocatellia bacterium]|nr:response regulator [Blastocatellia bacterium]
MTSKLSGHTILIVDNDATRRSLLKSSLQKDAFSTYSFVEKNTGSAATEFLQTVAVHAIFLAEQLPDIHTYSWLESIRAISNCQNLPILILVETENLSTVGPLLQAGASFCFSIAQISPLLLQQILLTTLTAKDSRQGLEIKKGGTPSIKLEERLRLAFEAAKMGYWEWDIQADRVRWRYQAEEIFGLQNEQFDGTMNGVLALIHPADRQSVERVLRSSIATGEDYKFEFRVSAESPEVRWLTGNGRTFFDENGSPTLMIGVLRDVTERVVAGLNLSASQQLNQAILDSLPEHIAVLDKAGIIVAINKAWKDFALHNGTGSDELQGTLGTNYLDVCEGATGDCSEEAAVVCNGIKSVLSGVVDHFRLEYPCHSPFEERWFLLQVTPLIRAGGGVVVSHLNITERRKIEARMGALLTEAQQAKESAENANRAKDEFIAQITHDLRSPLSAVLGWAKVLKNKKSNEQIREEAIQTIIESAEKQKNLIEDLLDISRTGMGKLRLDVVPVSLSAVIRSAMDVMQPACDAKEINSSTELATDADAVTGDPARLEQVIWNLVSNAVKFTPSNGQIKVRLERADPYVRITVSDTGCGIRPEHLPFIFERYWQPASSGGKRKGGLGLGLSLVKYIVELHGGTVLVESEGEGKGATFIINLPYRAVRLHHKEEIGAIVADDDWAEDTAPDLFLDSVMSSSALAGLVIVVVDDEPSARELVAEILRQHGATVKKADSAAAAFDLITSAEQVPDLLISDISMPDEDGYMLIRKIRNLPRHQGGAIPAVALTAFGRMEDRVHALSAGFQMHLPKPVEPAELALVAANLTNREITTFVQSR